MKISPLETELYYADGQTDGETRRISQPVFENFANASKKHRTFRKYKDTVLMVLHISQEEYVQCAMDCLCKSNGFSFPQNYVIS
jgi:hypothetical protein